MTVPARNFSSSFAMSLQLSNPIPSSKRHMTWRPSVTSGKGRLFVQRPNRPLDLAERKSSEIRAGDAGAFDQDYALSNWLERGPEVPFALERDHPPYGWFDPMGAKHIQVDWCFRLR